MDSDRRLGKVKTWLETLERPIGLSNAEYKTFMRYATEFVVIAKQLWHKDHKGQHKMVLPCDRRLFLITSAHNDVGHHGVYATNALLIECYWWPNMSKDIAWFIQTCHVC